MTQVNLHITGIAASALPSSSVHGGSNPASSNDTNASRDKAHSAATDAHKPAAQSLTLDAVAQTIERYIPDPLPNTRLSIVHDKSTDLFVYKSVDRDFGQSGASVSGR